MNMLFCLIMWKSWLCKIVKVQSDSKIYCGTLGNGQPVRETTKKLYFIYIPAISHNSHVSHYGHFDKYLRHVSHAIQKGHKWDPHVCLKLVIVT